MSRKRNKLKSLRKTKPVSNVAQQPAFFEPKGKEANLTRLKKRQRFRDEVQHFINVPQRTMQAFNSIEAVKNAFSLPVTLGSKDAREQNNMAFDAIGGYDAIFSSLTQHAYDMGEYPMTSFIGYGALQQIAQNGMIRACIQTVSDDICREWIEVTGSDDTDPDLLKKIQDLQETKYKLRSIFRDAATLTGYMGGCFIYIDTGCEESERRFPLLLEDWSQEFANGANVKFVVVDPINVTPGQYNAVDPMREDYMRPRTWWVLGKEVHASRLIPLVDNPPPVLLRPAYNFLGIPQAQILWDYVLHWNQCRVYTADLLRKVSLLVFQTDTDSIFGEAGGLQDFDLRMQALQRYRDNNSVFVCDKMDEGVSNVQTSITGCTDVVRQSLEMIAAINRTPAVKLLGISPSGFNATGDSDLTNYNDYIKSKQEIRRDAILKCLRAIQLAELGSVDESISFVFKEMDAEDDRSMADTASVRVNSLATLIDRNAISAEEMRIAAKNDPAMRLEFIDEEMPEELQQMQQQQMMGAMGVDPNGEEDQSEDGRDLSVYEAMFGKGDDNVDEEQQAQNGESR